MAISIVNKASAYSGTNAASYATGSWTPSANKLAICCVLAEIASTPVPPTSVTGNGLTWSKLADYNDDTSGTQMNVSIWVAKTGASPSAGAVTADFSAVTQAGACVIVDEVTGADVSGTALQAIVQSKNGSANASGTSESISLTSAITGSNASYGCFHHQADETTTVGSGYTQLGVGSHAGPSNAFMSEYKAAGSQTVDASWTTSIGKGGIACEIKVDTSGPITGTASITQAANTVSSTGTLPIVGSFSKSQAANTLSSDSDLFIVGQLSKSQDNNTISATGALSIIGQLSKTQDNNTIVSTGKVNIAGAANITQANNTLSAQSNITIVGSASLQQNNNTISSQAVITIVGSLSKSQDNNTIIATATLSLNAQSSLLQDDNTILSQATLPIVAQFSIDQSDNTLSATGELQQETGTGQVFSTQDDNTLLAISHIDLNATANLQQANNTLSASSSLNLSGTLSQAQSDNTLQSIGRLPIVGQLSITQQDNTLSANQPPPISGPGGIKIIHSIHEIIKAEKTKVIKAERSKIIRVE